MKTMMFALVLSISASAYADLETCHTKQKNAASFSLSQELQISVQQVRVTKFEGGGWTKMLGNNWGYDFVTVQAMNRSSTRLVSRKYEVRAQQIGMTDDCTIFSVRTVLAR